MNRVAVTIATLARLVAGALWLHEGVIKYRAGFGKADILLVVQSTAANSRVPGFYAFFTEHVLGQAPALFGFGIPLLEVGLGIAFLLGVWPLLVALASVGLLCNYWLSDQLVVQYPIMLAASVAVAVLAPAASRYSVRALSRS